MKDKQETADEKKRREEVEKAAAEAVKVEREAKLGELSAELEAVAGELQQTEESAKEAREAVRQADAFVAEQGENLDDEAKKEIGAIKEEAAQVEVRFLELKTQIEELNTQIAQLEMFVGNSERAEISQPEEQGMEHVSVPGGEVEKSVTENSEIGDTKSGEVKNSEKVEEIGEMGKSFKKLKEELKNEIIQNRKERLKILENKGDNFSFEVNELIDLYISLDKPEIVENALREEAKKREKDGHFYLATQIYEVLGDHKKKQETNYEVIDDIKSRIAEARGEGLLRLESYRALGEAYERGGDSEKARKIYEEITEAVEKEKRIPFNNLLYQVRGNSCDLAIIFEKLGDHQKAKEAWEKEARGIGVSRQEKAGEYYEKAGNYKKAKESYEKAIAYQEELERKGSEPNYKRLANAYAGIGNPQKAVEVLAKYARKLKHASEEYRKIEEYLG